MPLQVIGLEVVRYAGNHQLKMPKTSNPSDDVATWWREPILEEPKLLPSSVLHHLLTFPPTTCTSQQASDLTASSAQDHTSGSPWRVIYILLRKWFEWHLLRILMRAEPTEQDRIFRRQRQVSFLLLLPHVIIFILWIEILCPNHVTMRKILQRSSCEILLPNHITVACISSNLSDFYQIKIKQNSLNG